jgi:hypothetical protein
VDADFLPERAAEGVHAQRLDLLAMEARDHAGLVVDMVVDQRNLGGLGVVAKKLDVDVGQAGRRAVPHGTADMGPERRHPLHPLKGQFAQRAQFGGLGVGAIERDVVANLGFDLVVVGQGGALGQPEIAQRAALRRPVLEPFLHHQARGGSGDFTLGHIHAGILPARRLAHRHRGRAHP